MKPFVLAISGRIASGKSTLSLHIAGTLKCARASFFGDYVHQVATARGLELDGDTLQSVGAELVESGWEPFCLAVLSQSSWRPGQLLVIDGVRHVDAVPHLKILVAPVSLILVHVMIDEELRTGRIREREATSEASDKRNEMHSTERDVKNGSPASRRSRCRRFPAGGRNGERNHRIRRPVRKLRGKRWLRPKLAHLVPPPDRFRGRVVIHP